MIGRAPLLEVVVTARPSWARVKHLVLNYAQCYGNERVRLSLVGPAVSKRYGDLTKQLPEWLKVYAFPALHESDDLDAIALTCLEGSNALVRHWKQNRPDCVLVIADRTETLGVSLSAALMQIPLIHLQGGEISGSIDDKIRDTNTKLADLHLTTNASTKKRLEQLGESDENIHIIGCPSLDIVKEVVSNAKKELLSQKQLLGVGYDFDLNSKFGIIMFHPDTFNESENLFWTREIIHSIDQSAMNWFWFWPNPDHGTSVISREIRHAREIGKLSRVKFIINLPPEVFVRLAYAASIMVGNSSFGIREASFIGLPVINLGSRQNGRERGPNIVDLVTESEFSLLSKLINENSEKTFQESTIYGDGYSGMRGAKVIGEWRPRLKVRIN